MKVLAVALAALCFPAVALAEEVRLVTQEVPLRGERAVAATRPAVFNLVGLHWQGPGAVLFRTRSTEGRWSNWRDARLDPDAPRTSATWKLGSPHWVGAANAIQYRLRGRVSRLRAHFVVSDAPAVPPRTLSIAGSPPVIPRSAWRANESIRRGSTVYAPSLRFALVHHTAGANAYTAAQSAAIVRAIQTYHVKGNGWNDVGYNFLVDKYGQVFEGRYGGVERNVVGAHAEGFNTGSVGVAVLGGYGTTRPTAKALEAVAALIAWRLDVAHVDPLQRLSWISGGNARFPSGTPVPLGVVSAHRDTGPTACPGDALYAQVLTIARRAAALGLPKLYEPAVQGRVGAPVRFTARLSTSRPWTVTVLGNAENVIASGRGEGTAIDWTWDATFAAPARYGYVIEAGPDVRPAAGVIGQTAAPAAALTLSSAQARPATFTPNGDSVADATAISYSLSQAATVTATLRDAFGLSLATLFTQQKAAGRQSFRFSADGIADGRYTVEIVARSAGREARASVPIVVDRTLAAFTAAPPVFSPNGDRRLDQLTFRFVLAAPAHVRLRLAGGALIHESDLAPGQHELQWEERLQDGRYAAVLEATGPFGLRAQTARFAVDTTKPKLRLLSAAARRFSVGEAVTVVGTIGGARVEAKVGPGRFTLSGPPGRIAITAWDAAGNRSRLRHP